MSSATVGASGGGRWNGWATVMARGSMWDNRGPRQSRHLHRNPSMTARLVRIGVIAIVAFVLGLVLARALWPSRPIVPVTEVATVLPEPRALPGLDLVNSAGQPLGHDFFKGHWTLVFFGFTRCPDVCPTTLAMLAQVTRALGELPPAQRPRVLFVSLDPERDSVQLIGQYVSFFNPAFVGATGSPAAVAAAAAAFAVPYARVPLPDGGYTMDHGSATYVVGPSGGIEAIAAGVRDPQQLARDYRKVVAFVSERP
jgi:protein SCO1/2